MEGVVWKSFKLGKIFTPITGRDSTIAQKNLNKSNEKTEKYNVAIVTESTLNNGVGFYMHNDDPVLKNKIVEKGLTYGTQFGNANYHSYKHFIIGNTNYLKFNSDTLYEICDDCLGYYFAKLINKIFKKSELFGYVNKIDQNAFKREIILLPCIEVRNDEEYIWEEGGKYYTLATNYISYIYLSGRVNYNQKLVENYTYQY